ncbi:hypothetical protein F4775DRAFT_167064 [Biscogniauxia sp. FL1348]|nr:hypothetical protein F4775DRAFT_82484 [Biscogniauxia sp. FL1348]KAI0598647.1 hypothetical protein F4775DRAFT_167064 [Biscogniauxia sp. FL1348]
MNSLHPLRPLQAGSSLLAKSYLRPSLSTSRIFFPPRPRSCYGNRSFHTPATLAAVIEGTPDLLIRIHEVTHTPWFLTIPLIALGVNLVFRLPFSVYSQRVVERRAQCNTVLHAWSTRIQLDALRTDLHPSERKKNVKDQFERVRKRLYAKLDLQEWRLWSSFLSLPFWLIAIDGVRRLCGGPRGLLGALILGSGDNGPGSSTGSSTGSGTSPETSPETTSPTYLMTDDSIGSAPPVDLSAASGAAETVRQVIDPSLATEGCLWFPDLTVADPYHILPILLSASLLTNVIPRSQDSIRALFGLGPPQKEDKGLRMVLQQGLSLGFRRALLLAAAVVGPATFDLPAAVHLYWLSSSLVHMLLAAILARLIPLRLEMFKMCKSGEIPIIRVQRQRSELPSKRQQQQRTNETTK